MSNLASFWKPKACGQTELPDRSVLIGQTLVENAKIEKFKCDYFGWFSNTVKMRRKIIFSKKLIFQFQVTKKNPIIACDICSFRLIGIILRHNRCQSRNLNLFCCGHWASCGSCQRVLRLFWRWCSLLSRIQFASNECKEPQVPWRIRRVCDTWRTRFGKKLPKP